MRIEDLLDSCEESFFVFNNELKITAWNKQLAETFMFPQSQAINKSIHDVSFFVGNKNLSILTSEVLKGDTHNSFHNVYSDKKAGKVFYYTLIVSPIYNEAKQLEGGLGTVKDVVTVDKEQSGFSLSDFVFDDETLPKIAFSKSGQPLHFNEPYRNFWGLTPKSEKFIKNYYNLFQDEQLANLESISNLRKGLNFSEPEISVVEYDTKKTSATKKLKTVRKKISGFVKTNLDEQGKLEGIEITFVDISDKNEGGFNNPWFTQKFQKLTKNLPGVIYEYVQTEEEGHFSFISQSCEEVFGLTSEEIQAKPKTLKQLIHPDDIVSYLQSNKKAEEKFMSWEWEGRFIINNTTKWIRGNSRPEKMGNGTVVRYGILTDISTEKKALKSRENASKRLKLAINGANLGLWDWNLEDDSFIVNSRFAEILGYSQKELKSKFKNWKDFIHPNEQPIVHRKLINHLKGSTEFLDFEARVKNATGKWTWVSSKAQVTDRNSVGKAIRIAGTTQDINSRKQYEKILAQSEARYRGMVEYSPSSIIIIRDKKVVFANERAYQLLDIDWEKEDLIGMNWLDFVKPEFRQRALDRINHTYRSGTKGGQIVEETLIRKSGKEIIVEMVGFPFEDEGERAIQIIANDITDKVSTQKVLKRSEKLLTQLFDSSPIGIVLLDYSKRVVQINQGFQQIFGYTNEECYGKKLNQLIVPKDYHGQSINLNTLIAEGSVVSAVESVRKDKSGNQVPVMIYGVPVTLNGKTIAIYGIYVDIRTSKKVEEELKIRNEELDNFVYKVSHDLRAPLSSTLGLVHLAGLEDSDENLREYINLIGERITQLDRFISDVLSHSKNLKVDVNHAAIDFKSIIEQKFQELDYLPGASLVSKKITITGEPYFGDAWRISEVIRNLISNAIKYMKKDIENPYILVDVKVNHKEAKIVFTDNGIGISSEMLPRIFEMFYRATEFSEGSGIGLYIVKNAIKKLGGFIDIKSKEGEGTTFIITLPNHSEIN